MAQIDLPSALLPSLMDRLLDPESVGTAAQPGYSLPQIIESVREDLEELLNTRGAHLSLDAQFPELARSIASFGLPDLASLAATTPEERHEIGRIIEKVIALHEPRLNHVHVTLLKSRAVELRVRFHIDARLRVDPAPHVAFETELELSTGHALIRERT